MSARIERPTLRYASALVAVGLALLGRLAVDSVLDDTQPFATFLLAATVTAWFAGRGPAFLSLVLGLGLGDYFFVSPRGLLGPGARADLFSSVVYLLTGGAMVELVHSLTEARQRAERTADAIGESEQRYRVLAERADAASRAKDEFLSTLSHELRTPLQGMLGWVQVLRQGKLTPAKASRALDIIEESGRAQAQLIGDLLDVSRIVTGRLRLELRPVELRTILHAAADAIRPAALAKRVTLACSVNADIDPIAGDPDRLRQVVWNLLSNAIKFTPPAGRVELRLESDASEVRVVVSDSGEGISPDFLPHVFERFRQAESIRSARRQAGVGLGLAIVRHLVELHGGRVEARSDGVGLGATFEVILPRVSNVEVMIARAPAGGADIHDERRTSGTEHPRR